jgi:RNA polymerase sigma-70 factor (ECF subfamily)
MPARWKHFRNLNAQLNGDMTAGAGEWAMAAADDNAALNAAMERYASGDDSAFDRLYALLAPRLWAFCLRLTARRVDAEEVVQEAFLRLHRARATFVAGSTALHWAYAIARSAYLDRLRWKKRRPEEIVEGETIDAFATYSSIGGLGDRFADPEAQAHAQELVAVVERRLRSLPENQRAAFVLLKEEGLSVADAAAVLGTTSTAVKLRAHRAYEALREALDEAEKKGGAR